MLARGIREILNCVLADQEVNIGGETLNRVENLDGLRGLAALWVLIGHCMLLTGFSVPILGSPDLGVDLFIFLSGFLMAFQYELRRTKENWNSPGVWASFWARRFFRLSPLYFVFLAAALLAGKAIYADRMIIDSFLHNIAQNPQRYTDSSLTNVLMHVTYLYGMVPSYAFRTALPDWSLGLEMQFYAAFPFIVLLMRRVGWVNGAICLCLASGAIAACLKALGVAFPMPSFLPLKLHLFIAGMLIAAASGKTKKPYFFLAVLFAAVPVGGSGLLHIVVREIILTTFFALVHWRAYSSVDRLSNILGSSPFHWLGELSYGVYLVHLLILHPVAAWVIGNGGAQTTSIVRFSITVVVVAPVSYGIAWLTYFTVERPGQILGKRLIGMVGGWRQAAQTTAEKISAP